MKLQLVSFDVVNNELHIINDYTNIFIQGTKFSILKETRQTLQHVPVYSQIAGAEELTVDSAIFTNGKTVIITVEDLNTTGLVNPFDNDPNNIENLILVLGYFYLKHSNNLKPDIIVKPYESNSTNTSLTFPGRGTQNYGQLLNNNLLNLLENFAAPTPPSNPIEGQLWYNSTLKMLYTYKENNWVSNDVIYADSTPPTPPTIGQIWYDTSSQPNRPQLMVYNGTNWVSVADFYVLKSGDIMTGYLTLHANPTYAMHAATKQYVDNAVASISDERLKENIHNIENSLELLSQIRGVGFTWKETGKKSYGVIAQEVEQVIPEIVDTSEHDRKSVNYNALIGFLIEAVKRLDKRVKELESEKN